jgi:hypothetical protein
MSFLMVRNLATAACEARRCAQEAAEHGVDQVAVATEDDHGDPQDREGDLEESVVHLKKFPHQRCYRFHKIAERYRDPDHDERQQDGLGVR